MIDARVAEEIGKTDGDALTAQEIAQKALNSTTYLRVRTRIDIVDGTGFMVAKNRIVTCHHIRERMTDGTAESMFNGKRFPLAADNIIIDRSYAVAYANRL